MSEGLWPMSDASNQDPDPDRLKALGARIAGMKQAQERPEPEETHYSQAQHAWRMVIELVAGLLIGFGMGYGLDTLFGTLPLFLVIFTMLGFAAGVKTMLRSAREIQEKQAALAADDEDDEHKGG